MICKRCGSDTGEDNFCSKCRAKKSVIWGTYSFSLAIILWVPRMLIYHYRLTDEYIVLGIFILICISFISGIYGSILGTMSKKSPYKKMAESGFALSVTGIIFLIQFVFIGITMMPYYMRGE